MDVFDVAQRYKSESNQVIILAGKEYGSGSSRDWAAKGPYLQGVRAVIAESYERIHRSEYCVVLGMLFIFHPAVHARSKSICSVYQKKSIQTSMVNSLVLCHVEIRSPLTTLSGLILHCCIPQTHVDST